MAEQRTESIAAAAERAADACEALAARAETVEDEWQYVADLVAVYVPSLRALGSGRESEALGEERAAAVDEAIAEIELIDDPHKAIDWLSTFPHVVALALGGNVDAADGVPPGGAGTLEFGGRHEDDNDDSDDESPFRILLGGER